MRRIAVFGRSCRPVGGTGLPSPLTCFLSQDSVPGICQPRSHRTGLPVVPLFPHTVKESLSMYYHLPPTTHFMTQRENFNKTPKDLLPVTEGRLPAKEAAENTPQREARCHPVLLSTCHHSPRPMLTGPLFSCSQCCFVSFSWSNVFISDLLQTIN